jgi:hypothetical protein
MKAKFITVKGSERLGTEPFYMGVLQHERTMSRREAYEYIAGKTGYTPTAVRAVFMAVAEYIRENQARGNITYFDGVASIRNYVRGPCRCARRRDQGDDDVLRPACATARSAATAKVSFRRWIEV